MPIREYIRNLEPGLFLAFLIVPAGLWLVFRPSRWRGMHLRGDRVVFPTATGWQIAGVFVAYVCGSFAVVSAREAGVSQWQVPLMGTLFVLAGISVLFREIQVSPDCFTKRFLWKTQKISWTEAEDLHRSTNRSWVLSGGLKQISFDRNYADFELLILEVVKRLNSKQDKSVIPPTSAILQ